MAPPDLSARPLALAEIIDRSIALGRRHFRPLFAAMLAIQAPAVLLARQLPDPLEVLGTVADPGRAYEHLARPLQLVGALFVALVALQAVGTAAAAVIVRPSLDPRPGAARPGPARVAWATATAALAQVVVVTAGPVLGFVPGMLLVRQAETLPTALVGAVGGLLGSVLLLVVLTLRLMVAPAVAALEGRAGLAALARSSRLMGPRPGTRLWERPGVRASLVLLAGLVLALAVNALAGLPRLVAQRIVGGEGGLAALSAHLPVALELPLTLVEAVAAAAVQPFSLVCVVVFYFDRRARTEALDLEIWAGRLGEASR